MCITLNYALAYIDSCFYQNTTQIKKTLQNKISKDIDLVAGHRILSFQKNNSFINVFLKKPKNFNCLMIDYVDYKLSYKPDQRIVGRLQIKQILDRSEKEYEKV